MPLHDSFRGRRFAAVRRSARWCSFLPTPGPSRWIPFVVLIGVIGLDPLQSRASSVETVDAVIDGVASIALESTDGTPTRLQIPGRSLELRDVLRIGLEPSFTQPGEFAIELGDGSRLVGSMHAPSEGSEPAEAEAIRISSAFFAKPRDIPLESIRRIERLVPGAEPVPAPSGRESDHLHPTSGGTVSGVLVEVTHSGVRFEDDELGTLTFEWPQLRAVDFASLGAGNALPPKSIEVALEGPSGGLLRGALIALDDRAVTVENPLIGQVLAPLRQLAGIEVRMGRVQYLSDREPVEVEQGGDPDLIDPEIFGQFFGWQRDRSVERTPLIVGERTFRKGLGVHARCRLVYAVAAGDRVFQSWVGLDATARPPTRNPKYGSVVFKVIVDGDVRSTTPMSWKDPARRIETSLQGAKRIELIVEEGPGSLICDRADWGDARIVRD
ncbi:MAG: NPCBM/NEW2 domain-containing protein [Planctomycetes bacterium]|nr:NPCBM/NEW2 domain-containing protein [Planctomycetota bacterium]